MPLGRPLKSAADKFRIVQIAMPPELIGRLDEAAVEAHETRSQFVRASIELELRRLGDDFARADRGNIRLSLPGCPDVIVTTAEARKLAEQLSDAIDWANNTNPRSGDHA